MNNLTRRRERKEKEKVIYGSPSFKFRINYEYQ